MKNSLSKLIRFFRRCSCKSPNINSNDSLIGSWRLISLTNPQGKTEHPRWKEVWSFATMDESETYGIYSCDYINLHTIIGKWYFEKKHLKLIRKECECEYILIEVSDKNLILKPNLNDSKETLIFQRVV